MAATAHPTADSPAVTPRGRARAGGQYFTSTINRRNQYQGKRAEPVQNESKKGVSRKRLRAGTTTVPTTTTTTGPATSTATTTSATRGAPSRLKALLMYLGLGNERLPGPMTIEGLDSLFVRQLYGRSYHRYLLLRSNIMEEYGTGTMQVANLMTFTAARMKHALALVADALPEKQKEIELILPAFTEPIDAVRLIAGAMLAISNYGVYPEAKRIVECSRRHMSAKERLVLFVDAVEQFFIDVHSAYGRVTGAECPALFVGRHSAPELDREEVRMLLLRAVQHVCNFSICTISRTIDRSLRTFKLPLLRAAVKARRFVFAGVILNSLAQLGLETGPRLKREILEVLGDIPVWLDANSIPQAVEALFGVISANAPAELEIDRIDEIFDLLNSVMTGQATCIGDLRVKLMHMVLAAVVTGKPAPGFAPLLEEELQLVCRETLRIFEVAAGMFATRPVKDVSFVGEVNREEDDDEDDEDDDEDDEEEDDEDDEANSQDEDDETRDTKEIKEETKAKTRDPQVGDKSQRKMMLMNPTS